jgi:hypothetical protein
MKILRGLGIEPQGRVPPASGSLAFFAGRLHVLPAGAVSLLSTSLLDLSGKLELGRLLARLPTLRPEGTLDEWLHAHVTHSRVREVLRALMRVSTYANHPQLPAALAFDQLRLAAKQSVLYLDGGWQQLIDALRARALQAGVKIVEQHRAASLGENETVLAVTPREAAELLPSLQIDALVPVRAACLDLALSALPKPRRTFALGIDQPLYFSVHSATAQLGPHVVIQAAKYLGPDDRGAESVGEIEALVDAMQPGWRKLLVARRFLPEMTVVNALPGARAVLNPAPLVWLAGDWVGEEGMLLDCALSSAAEVSRRILGAPRVAAAA